MPAGDAKPHLRLPHFGPHPPCLCLCLCAITGWSGGALLSEAPDEGDGGECMPWQCIPYYAPPLPLPLHQAGGRRCRIWPGLALPQARALIHTQSAADEWPSAMRRWCSVPLAVWPPRLSFFEEQACATAAGRGSPALSDLHRLGLGLGVPGSPFIFIHASPAAPAR